MAAIASLPAVPILASVDMPLPPAFRALEELAFNLWWSWKAPARRMFSHIDSSAWARYRNPVQLLLSVPAQHWEVLLHDDHFMHNYQQVVREFRQYVDASRPTWFSQHQPAGGGGPIAYFSTEFGFHESLPIYCGGLGVLSGDHCKSASDLGLPFVGVGLFYRNGYFRQEVDMDGRQQHIYPGLDVDRLPMQAVADGRGRRLLVEIPIGERKLYAMAWRLLVGRISVLLLDTDVPENSPEDRPITSQLYVVGREMRLLQELVLGWGGVRLLRQLGIEPGCWHMNEGHSAFLGLERARLLMQEGGVSFDEACRIVRASALFTTHTPIPAGNEVFEASLVMKYLRPMALDLGVPVESLLELGRAFRGRGDHQEFNLTVLAIRLASWVNGVSHMHASVATEMWRHVLEAEPQGQVNNRVAAVTNGVHTETWCGLYMDELLDQHLGRHWPQKLLDRDAWSAVRSIPDDELWHVHQDQKLRLLTFLRKQIAHSVARYGAAPEQIQAAARLFGQDVLTLGWARRFVEYKRAALIFRDWERVKALLLNPDRPVQLIFSGKAHPADREGQALIQRIVEISIRSELRDHVVFLEDYNMRTARMLVQGVDLWLNTPRAPREASGTSGQKVPINGGVNLSVLDGWWPEGFAGTNGWAIESPPEYVHNPDAADWADATRLYELLEREVVPLFYDRDTEGIPHGWVERMKDSMISVIPAFSSIRMVAEYAIEGYFPAMARAQRFNHARVG